MNMLPGVFFIPLGDMHIHIAWNSPSMLYDTRMREYSVSILLVFRSGWVICLLQWRRAPVAPPPPHYLAVFFFFQISILMSVHCWWCVHCVALMTNEVGHMFTLACLHLWGGAYFLMLLFSFDSFGFSLQLLSILYMWVFKLMNVLEYSFPLCEWSSQAPDGMFNEREFIIL